MPLVVFASCESCNLQQAPPFSPVRTSLHRSWLFFNLVCAAFGHKLLSVYLSKPGESNKCGISRVGQHELVLVVY